MSFPRSRAAIAAIVAIAGLHSSALCAQGPASIDTSRHAKTLFTRNDAVLAAGFVGLTVAMFPVDQEVARRLQDSATQANHFLRNASRDIQYFGDPGAVVIGLSMYVVGRIGGWHNAADLGLHGTEAVAYSGLLTAAIKDLAGRARPYVSADTSPHDFGFGRGRSGGKYQSFPSGHTTAAFAAAAAVTSESQRWWPRATWIVAPVMYGGAALVGASRMYNNAHWASDVALGAAIGTFTGLKVVRYSHQHPDNPIDRLFLGAPASSGRLTIGWRGNF